MAFPPWKFFVASCITALFGYVQFGYNAGIINIPQHEFMQFINETNIDRYGMPMADSTMSIIWAWIVSIMPVGGLVGSLCTPVFADRLGRKTTLMILSPAVCIFGTVITCFFKLAHSYEMIAVGRFFIGFGSSVATGLVPVYMTECSPTQWRGLVGNLQNICFQLISIVVCVIAMPMVLGNGPNLPYLLGLSVVPAFLQIVSSFFLHETPKFLYIKRKDIVSARKSLNFWHSSPGPEPVDEKIVLEEFDREASALDQELGFFKAMKIPCFRKILFTSLAITFCTQASGIAPLGSYSTDMFLKLGFSADVAAICSTMTVVAMTIGSFIVMPFIEKYPRRACYFVSYAILIATWIIYIIFAVIHKETGWVWPSYMAMISIYALSVIFNFGAGALMLIIPAEISPQAIRSTVLSVSNALASLIGLVLVFIYPPVELLIGPWTILIFLVPLVITLIYLYKVLPETRGRSIADIISDYTPFNGQGKNGQVVEKP